MSAIDTLLNMSPRLRDGMVVGSNLVMVRCPFHSGGNEQTPSLAISLSKPVWFCFAAGTRVLTKAGTREIQDLVGGEHEVLVPGGYWVKAPFYALGKQEIWELRISRNGIKKTIRTTAEHRWFLKGKYGSVGPERITSQLKQGDTLHACFPVPLSTRVDGAAPIRPSAFGIARGFVYGDGTLSQKAGSGSVAYFHGKKDAEMRKYFPLSPGITAPHLGNIRTRVSDLPSYFKTELPPIGESVSYLYGWLAGYFAADGDITKGGYASINSAKLEDLQKIRDICTRVGIATTGIKTYHRKGFNGVEPIHRLSFFTSTVTKDFFLLTAHRRRFLAVRKEYERRHWQVESVINTKVREPVYCATVPHRNHAFTLEDNILTGNCHSCQTSGHIAQLLANAGLSHASIAAILPKQDTYQKQTLGAKILRTKDLFRGPFILDEGLLDNYRLCPTSLLQAGFKKETLRHFEVGYDTTNIRITYPLRNVYGNLVGVSGRSALDGIEPRYKIYDSELKKRQDFHVPDDYNMEAVKSAVLWHGHVVRPLFFKNDHKSDFIVITEGFKACMWTWQSGLVDVVALVGAYLTDHHAELICRVVPNVVLFLDNNKAGWKGTKLAATKLLAKSVNVFVARYPDDREQPDDLDQEETCMAVCEPLSIREWTREHIIPEEARHLLRKGANREQRTT